MALGKGRSYPRNPRQGVPAMHTGEVAPALSFCQQVADRTGGPHPHQPLISGSSETWGQERTFSLFMVGTGWEFSKPFGSASFFLDLAFLGSSRAFHISLGAPGGPGLPRQHSASSAAFPISWLTSSIFHQRLEHNAIKISCRFITRVAFLLVSNSI